MLIHMFCKICKHEIDCMKANQNKNNFRFTTITKHGNNQTNCYITFEKIEENMDLSLIHLALTDMIWTFLTTHSNQGDVKMLLVKY